MKLDKKHIVIGVSAGIAAYKVCTLVRRLRQKGAQVRVAMSKNATGFIGPMTFQALSGNPVSLDVWDGGQAMGMEHLELAGWADVVLLAPATADLLARLAQGRADDLLTTLCLATAAPVVAAPAMNHRMWTHAATQANVTILKQRGVMVIGPEEGSLAEGESGPGRLLEAGEIIAQLQVSCRHAIFQGRHVVVSAGPTFEDIDPVRFVANRSSGRMGFAMARAAQAAGAQVTLVAGPSCLAMPFGVERIPVRSASEMHSAVLACMDDCDVFIGAAAVGDYRVAEYRHNKIKKTKHVPEMSLALVENPDILRAVAALDKRPFILGFAAETEQVKTYARDKLKRKKIDMIAANQVGYGKGFDTLENTLTLYWGEDGEKHFANADKNHLAAALIAYLGTHLAKEYEQT